MALHRQKVLQHQPKFWFNAIRWLFFIAVFQSNFTAHSQISILASREKSAMVKMQEKKWTEARQLLETALEKNPNSIEGLYALSYYFSSPANPRCNPDSARSILITTSNYFKNADAKAIEKLEKFPITDQLLKELKEKIDQLAFEKAYAKSTIESLSHFLKSFSDAPQREQAMLKRDSLSFDLAAQKNSAQAYKNYISQWPESHLKTVATERFDELNFKEKTRNGSASEYEAFYLSFPESKWRDHALEKVFELMTLNGQKESFQNFINKFSGTALAKRATDIITYLNTDYGSGLWIPVAEKKKLGFISFDGKILVRPKFDSLSYSILCSEEHTGLIILPDGIYARNGRLVLSGTYAKARTLGAGYLLTSTTDSQVDLVHETGWRPLKEAVQDATLIADRFLAIKLGNKWQLSGLAGQPLLPPVYDSIFQIGTVAIFKRSGKYQFVKHQDILSYRDEKAPERVVEQLSLLGTKYIKVKVGGMEEVLNEDLKPVVPLDRHIITLSPAGFIIEKNKSLTLTEWPILTNKTFKKIEFPEPWMKTYSAIGHDLYFLQDKSAVTTAADSIWFKGKFAFARKKDSVTLFTPLKQRVSFNAEDEVRFISSADSGLFFLVKKKTQLQLFDALSGRKLISGAYSEITPVTKDFYTVNLKNKMGLVKAGGKEVLPADYDAILFQNGWFSLLKEKKFGGYNPYTGRILKPIYDANILPYSEDLMMARKNKKWGILHLKQKPEKATFPFDEVKYVNDSLALVKKQVTWSMIKVYNGEVIADNIADWQPVEDGDRIIFKSGEWYGLISPTTGIVIKPRFSEIIWRSDDHKSLFIGLQPSSGKEITIEYINRYGLTLQKFTCDEKLLDLILCDN